jgi:hypothetical protein
MAEEIQAAGTATPRVAFTSATSEGFMGLKIPLWLLRVLSVFPLSGFVGADHFVVGSNLTGGAKAILNILTLGSWYFYDLIYVLSSDDVVTQGFNLPFFESMPIAKGMVTEKALAGMEKTVTTISRVLFVVIMFTVAFFSWKGSSNMTGGWHSLLLAAAYISGGIGVLIIAMSFYSMYTGMKSKVDNITNTLTNPLSIINGLPGPAPVQAGGGRKSLQTIAEEMLVQRKANEMPTESLIFMGILLVIAVGGITYAVFQAKKQSKAKKEDEDASDTDRV